jgi:hypothetical protein
MKLLITQPYPFSYSFLSLWDPNISFINCSQLLSVCGRSEILTEVLLKIQVFWVGTSHRNFEVSYCLHSHGQELKEEYCLTMKMKAQ